MRLNNDIDFSIYNKTNLGLKQEKKTKSDLIKEIDKDEQGKNIALLELCHSYWDGLYNFRARRRRARRYYRGYQWKDRIVDPENSSKTITEEEYIERQGKIPLKQNMIRQIVKNLLGQYRSNPTKTIVVARARENASETEMLSNALQSVHHINQGKELDVRNCEEFILSGACPQKIIYKYFPTRNIEDVYFENISPRRIFFNTDIEDFRLTDLRLVGEIIDTDIESIIAAFAKTEKDETKIRELYAMRGDDKELDYYGGIYELSSTDRDSINFFIPQDPSKCRLYEVWRIKSDWRLYIHDPTDASYDTLPYSKDLEEQIKEENDMRMKAGLAQGILADEIPFIDAVKKYESFWYGSYLTPDGNVLWEGETPYKHGEHPYALYLYPLIDGEVWGFVEDIIDQQRYINRLIIMLDFIMSASAKGVLLVPEDSVPEGTSPQEFADEWTKFNGVIFYKPTQRGDIPQQISASSTAVGIHEALAIQMKLIQEISGVHTAIQGIAPKSGTPASLYAQEAQNATLNSMDYLQTYSNFKAVRDNKILKLILQYYNEERHLLISGSSYDEEAKLYDPSKVQDIDFEAVITQSMDTPVYRQLIDDTLMKLLEAQQIDIEMFLEHTSMPFADKLLDAVKKRRQEMMNNQGGELSPELMQEGTDQSNPQAMALLNQASGMQQAA